MAGNPRRIRCTGDEARALRGLRRQFPDSAFVFTTERGGPFTPDAVNRLIRRIDERARPQAWRSMWAWTGKAKRRKAAAADAFAEGLRETVTPLAGQTMRAIAKVLNEAGIKTARGGDAIAASHAPARSARPAIGREGGFKFWA